MKKFIMLLLLSISINCFANDLLIHKDSPCPNGGYRSSNNAYWCCKDGFMLEPHSRKYDGVQAIDCGCPYGGTPSETCKAECCKDGYAFGENSPPMSYGSGKYDVLKPGCCCPYGGTRVKTGECCKDGNAFNKGTNKYDLVNGNCGCPDGGIQSTRDLRGEKFCCKDGFMYDNETHAYSRVWSEFCGCPENGISIQTGKYNFECCNSLKPGYRWSGDSYSDYTPEYCGCPDGGELKEGREKNELGLKEFPYCCKNNYLYDQYKKTYSKVDIRCGCPKGHEEECAKQKEFQENPEKALKEFMAFIQNHKKQKK